MKTNAGLFHHSTLLTSKKMHKDWILSKKKEGGGNSGWALKRMYLSDFTT
jgi:hypothetical protein